MTASHTPGPYLTAEDDPSFIYTLNDNGENRFSAHIQICKAARGTLISREEVYATARLFAAAPDLLEACKACFYRRKDARECERMMGAAIAKVEGR